MASIAVLAHRSFSLASSVVGLRLHVDFSEVIVVVKVVVHAITTANRIHDAPTLAGATTHVDQQNHGQRSGRNYAWNGDEVVFIKATFYISVFLLQFASVY